MTYSGLNHLVQLPDQKNGMVRPVSINFVFILLIFTGCRSGSTLNNGELSTSRGIVVYPADIQSTGSERYTEILKGTGLNLLGIHGFNDEETPDKMESFIESSEGRLLLKRCAGNGIDVEFETHAIHVLLPRNLFSEHPEYFRMDENGKRRNDLNMCFFSEGAYQEIEKKLREITKWLKPTTNRYFFWADDGLNGYCHCDSCRKYSESEQALIYENRLLSMLRKINPKATLAHLAYNNTCKAPAKVKPNPGIFLEYAPIDRDISKPVPEDHLQDLKKNLEVFPSQTAHILEYWIDESKFAGWNRNSLVEIPWNMNNCARDLNIYRSLGCKSITSFGAWINQQYFDRFGESSARKILKEYGSVLQGNYK